MRPRHSIGGSWTGSSALMRSSRRSTTSWPESLPPLARRRDSPKGSRTWPSRCRSQSSSRRISSISDWPSRRQSTGKPWKNTALHGRYAEQTAVTRRRGSAAGDLEPIERASRDELESLQLERLKWSLRHAYDHVPSFRVKCEASDAHPDNL